MSHFPSRSARAATAALLALAWIAAPGCKEAAPPPPRAAPKVTVAFPETRDVGDEQIFNGWTAAVETVDVRSRVRGHIEKVNFKDGDIVKAGALLFTLDARPFQADVDQAVANRRVFEAQEVAESKEQARLEALLEKGGASQKQVEKKQADVLALKAQIAATTSEIERLQLNVEFSKITSPIAGRASKATLTAGNLVGAGGSDPVLTTVVSLNPIQIYFDISERALLEIREMAQKKDPARLKESLSARKLPFSFGLDTDSGFPREGILDFNDNTVDAGTGTLRLRGIAQNEDGFLVPGSRVKVRIAPGEAAQSLLVPDVALASDQTLRYVLVVGPDDKVLRKDVRPGRLLEDGMRVLLPVPGAKDGEGVLATDRVIIEGQARARLFEPAEALDKSGKPVALGANAPAPAGK